MSVSVAHILHSLVGMLRLSKLWVRVNLLIRLPVELVRSSSFVLLVRISSTRLILVLRLMLGELSKLSMHQLQQCFLFVVFTSCSKQILIKDCCYVLQDQSSCVSRCIDE